MMEKSIPWRAMLIEINGSGMKWSGIARHLDASPGHISEYANGNGELRITFDRGISLLKLYSALYPERFKTKIKPLVEGVFS